MSLAPWRAVELNSGRWKKYRSLKRMKLQKGFLDAMTPCHHGDNRTAHHPKIKPTVQRLSLGQHGDDSQSSSARFPERRPRRDGFTSPNFACPWPVRRSENTTPITPYQRPPKPLRRGLTGRNQKILCAKDFRNASTDQRQTRYLADPPSVLLARAVEPCFENPCVGGSIPPRATKNIVHVTPTHAGWRCRFWDSHSSCPVYLRTTALC